MIFNRSAKEENFVVSNFLLSWPVCSRRSIHKDYILHLLFLFNLIFGVQYKCSVTSRSNATYVPLLQHESNGVGRSVMPYAFQIALSFFTY